jgi:hypothetical protein
MMGSHVKTRKETTDALAEVRDMYCPVVDTDLAAWFRRSTLRSDGYIFLLAETCIPFIGGSTEQQHPERGTLTGRFMLNALGRLRCSAKS